jgi:hypothetical protein
MKPHEQEWRQSEGHAILTEGDRVGIRVFVPGAIGGKDWDRAFGEMDAIEALVRAAPRVTRELLHLVRLLEPK